MAGHFPFCFAGGTCCLSPRMRDICFLLRMRRDALLSRCSVFVIGTCGVILGGGGLISSWRWRSDGRRALIIHGGGVLPGQDVRFENNDPRWRSLCTTAHLTATINIPLCAVFPSMLEHTASFSNVEHICPCLFSWALQMSPAEGSMP